MFLIYSKVSEFSIRRGSGGRVEFTSTCSNTQEPEVPDVLVAGPLTPVDIQQLMAELQDGWSSTG